MLGCVWGRYARGHLAATDSTLSATRTPFLSTAALVGMTTTGQLEGQPLEAFHTCLYGLSVGIGAYLVGRFLTTPTDTQAGAARA